MPKIDIDKLKVDTYTGYPEPFRRAVEGRERKRLGNAVGLDQFGVNLTRLKPGAASSQRHWHENEDEFVYMLEGELVLSRTAARPCSSPATPPAGRPASPTAIAWSTAPTATRSISRSAAARRARRANYPDIDMRAERDDKGMRYVHKDGTPYPGSER